MELKFIVGLFDLKKTFIRKSKAWLMIQWECRHNLIKAISSEDDFHLRSCLKMTFFEKLLWLADAAMGKSTGGRSYFLRAAREQQHHLVKLDQQYR